MSKKIITLFIAVVTTLSVISAKGEHVCKVCEGKSEIQEDLNGWSIDVALGIQTSINRSVRIGAASPYLFGNKKYHKNYRVAADIESKELAYNDLNLTQINAYFESDNYLFGDIVYGYGKIGLGLLLTTSEVYDEVLQTVPLAFGISIITHRYKGKSGAFIIEYKTNLIQNYRSKNRGPKAAFSGFDNNTFVTQSSIFIGTRITL